MNIKLSIKDTYNIHKKLNCMFPIFKSKMLCKKDIHNYQLQSSCDVIPIVKEIYMGYDKPLRKEITYKRILKDYWKCYCCRKEVDIDE